MRILDLKPVKRCGRCYHLIPAEFKRCPYCDDSYIVKRPETEVKTEIPPIPVKRVKVEIKPMSPKTKKLLILIAIGVVALGLVIAGIMFVMSFFRLDKSILEPLDSEVVAELSEEYPEFYNKYRMIENLRNYIVTEEDKKEFGKITYKEMISFLEAYNDTAFCNNAVREARKEFESIHHQPLIPQIKAEKKKWEDFLAEHDPSSYLEVDCCERYEMSDGEYYAGFYFNLSYPKGAIENCYAHYGLVTKGTDDEWCIGANSYGNLEELMERSSDKSYRWNYVSSYSADIYDNFYMKCEVFSVTLPDGTVISRDDVEQVPEEAMAYITDPSRKNEVAFIKALVMDSYPDEKEFVEKALEEKFEKTNARCLKLIKRSDFHCNYSIPIGIGMD